MLNYRIVSYRNLLSHFTVVTEVS